VDLDLDQLAAAVLRLPAAARAELASRLLESLDVEEAESPDVVAAAWAAELDRREAEFEADPSIGIPAAEVFRTLRADLAARRPSEAGH
jgi:putative addiction module component (TIGR02574 family)